MNLKERWGGTRVWADASTKDLIDAKLNEFEGGELETLKARVDALAGIVAALLDASPLTEEQTLDVIGLHQWELATQAEVDA